MIKKRRVEDILAESLQELIQAKDFQKITVEDIVSNCSLTRTTFYRHFQDKYELMNWIYLDMSIRFKEEHHGVYRWDEFLFFCVSFIRVISVRLFLYRVRIHFISSGWKMARAIACHSSEISLKKETSRWKSCFL